MPIIYTLIAACLVIIAVYELANWIVLGSMIDEQTAQMLFVKIERANLVSKGMIHFRTYDFASKHHGIFSKWYFYKDGVNKQVKRGSRLEKSLDAKYKQLILTSKNPLL